MPARDRNKLGKEKFIWQKVLIEVLRVCVEELEQEEKALGRNEESIKVVRRSIFFKFRYIYRPVQIILGVLLLLFAFLIFISLLLSNIDKCIHFISFKHIFAQGNKTLPNPIDIVISWTGHVRREIALISKRIGVFFCSFIHWVILFYHCYWFILSWHRFLVSSNWAFGIFGFE